MSPTRPVNAAPPERDSKVWRWACVLIPGFLIYFTPLGDFTPTQRHLLAFFVATIIALATRPAPMGVVVFLSMTLIALTGTLPLDRALSGFSSTTVWLIFSAFLFAQAVSHTRLGLRIAYFFISRLAKTSLTLGYAVAASNLVLSPFMPSDTARGGIVAPIIRNVAEVLGSKAGATSSRIGSYLTLVGFHTNYLASALFLTSMAGNPLIAKFAYDIAGVEITWAHWALAASVPGLVAFAIIPWILFHLETPALKDTSHAQAFAESKLEALGAISRQESTLLTILLVVILGWIASPWLGFGNTTIAMAGICAILLSGVLSWEDIIGNTKAWEVLIWFAPLLMMADELSQQGVIKAIFDAGFGHMQGWPWAFALAALILCYVYVHYGFASLTAHISALYPGFLGSALVAGVPAPLAALSLAFASTINAGLTHYGTGSAPIYFSSGYVPQNTWWSVGFIISLVNLAIWMGLGTLWWNAVGLW